MCDRHGRKLGGASPLIARRREYVDRGKGARRKICARLAYESTNLNKTAQAQIPMRDLKEANIEATYLNRVNLRKAGVQGEILMDIEAQYPYVMHECTEGR